MAARSHIEVIVGTYEELLVGYTLRCENDAYTFKQSFTNHSHCGSVKCIASSEKYVVSGSTDETIKIFNMNKRTEVGTLMQHEGSIVDLKFFGGKHLPVHLFSCSEDGTICVWRVTRKDWKCLKTLRGHKGPLTSLAIHPSGKLALSVSKDKTVRTWDLLTGKTAFVTHLQAVSELVEWSPDGLLYAVVVDKVVQIYEVEKAKIIHSIDFGRRINAISFINDSELIIGGDGQNVEIHAANKEAIRCTFPAHSTRVKALTTLRSPEKEDEKLLISSSSDGSIKLWSINVNKLHCAPTLLAEVKTGCRIMCHTVHLSEKDVGAEQPDETTSESDQEETTGSEQPVKGRKRKTAQKPRKKKSTSVG